MINLNIIKRVISRLHPYSSDSFSQNGEDVLINHIFKDIDNGFYIDVGAYHPIKFSNTYKLYQRGWSGINIDALPGSMMNFEKKRKRDINLEIPIYDQENEVTYYQFAENAFNTIDLSVVQKHKKNGIFPTKTYQIKTKTLESILNKFLPQNKNIDLLDIDVEGIDFNVLKSINLEKYRPKVILIEIWSTTIDDLIKSKVNSFLIENDYLFYAKLFDTNVFISREFYNIRFYKNK